MTTATAAVPTTGIKLQIHRKYNATAQALFDAWTKPELLKEWFGPNHLTITDTSTDPRVGGRFHIGMDGPSLADPSVDQAVAATGVYTVFDPPTHLAFTWNGSWAPGEESLVSVALTPADGGTELLLTHERFLSERSRDGHNDGWNNALDKLATLFPAA